MDDVNYNVNFQGGITDPSQIEDIAVGSKDGVPIYLRDIATDLRRPRARRRPIRASRSPASRAIRPSRF